MTAGTATVGHAAAITAAVAGLALIVHYVIERRYVRRAIRAMIGGTESIESAAGEWLALRLASVLHTTVPRIQDPIFLHPLLGPLGATPGQILRSGGCCSGMGRILIVGCNELGIRAAQLTLNNRSDEEYQHCIVETWADGRPTLIDPDYGLQFVDADGGPLRLEALQASVEPHIRPLPGKETAAYPDHPAYNWDYRKTNTANWKKSLPRRAAHRVLMAVTRGGIDRWRQPVALEWPQLVLASGLFGLAAMIEALRVFL